MAVYKSKYAELSFYVDGSLRSFKNGRYATEDKEAIKVLDSLPDTVKVDDPKADKGSGKSEEPQKQVNTRNRKPKSNTTTKSTKKADESK